MLRRSKRINSSGVKLVLSKGANQKTPHFVFKRFKNELGWNRYAIVISKKVEKSAVKRNYKRRQIYHIFKELDVPSQSSFDIVLLAKKSLLTLSFQDLKDSIKQYLNG